MFFRQDIDFNYSAFILICEILLFSPFVYMALKFLTPLSYLKRSIAKLSAYECGFNPYSLRRTQIDIKFYLLALLFLVFDIEILILLPFILGLYENSFFEFTITFIFLLSIFIGILWEINSGVLVFT